MTASRVAYAQKEEGYGGNTFAEGKLWRSIRGHRKIYTSTLTKSMSYEGYWTLQGHTLLPLSLYFLMYLVVVSNFVSRQEIAFSFGGGG